MDVAARDAIANGLGYGLIPPIPPPVASVTSIPISYGFGNTTEFNDWFFINPAPVPPGGKLIANPPIWTCPQSDVRRWLFIPIPGLYTGQRIIAAGGVIASTCLTADHDRGEMGLCRIRDDHPFYNMIAISNRTYPWYTNGDVNTKVTWITEVFTHTVDATYQYYLLFQTGWEHSTTRCCMVHSAYITTLPPV